MQMKYRDSLDGTSVTDYLYSNAGKLAVIKNFRDEALELMKEMPENEVKASPVVHLRDYSSTD